MCHYLWFFNPPLTWDSGETLQHKNTQWYIHLDKAAWLIRLITKNTEWTWTASNTLPLKYRSESIRSKTHKTQSSFQLFAVYTRMKPLAVVCRFDFDTLVTFVFYILWSLVLMSFANVLYRETCQMQHKAMYTS